MLLGKYAARPAIPYLMSLAMLGLGIAGAVSPYLAITLAKQDPRLPFVIASIALVLTSLALAKVERSLAKDAPAKTRAAENRRPRHPRHRLRAGRRDFRARLPAALLLQQRAAL